jgi:hypothetical protein
MGLSGTLAIKLNFKMFEACRVYSSITDSTLKPSFFVDDVDVE